MKEKVFEFGKNWSRFIRVLNEDRINKAINSLKDMLIVETLSGKTFIDIGSGSGLFSLAAMKLGAKQVYSFDRDKDCVKCTMELKRRQFDNNGNWIISEGSVLDNEFLKSLGEYDIVYSWGVLHQTGAMWQSFENIVPLVKSGGMLYIAIYNDQGRASRFWRFIKSAYNSMPKIIKLFMAVLVCIRFWFASTIRDILKGRPFYSWRNYSSRRGMSAWYDVVDWVGGYPFEVAKPEQIFDFFKKKNFKLERLITCGGGSGCCEYVFRKQI